MMPAPLFSGLLLCAALLFSGWSHTARSEQMLAGNLSSVGSDTLATLMAFWAADFNQHYPSVNVQMQAGGIVIGPHGTCLRRGTTRSDEPCHEGQ